MGVPANEPSIRVELTKTDGQDSDALAPASGQRPEGKGALVALAVGVAALIIVAFIALRPEGGQAADGTERQAPTTTTEAPTESTTVTTTAAPPLVAEVIDLDLAIREVVNAPLGYVAVQGTTAPRGAPPILRSIDGVDWTAVDAAVLESDEFDLLRSRFAAFIGLEATDAGFTILRVRQQLAEPGRTDTGFFIVDRIASADGVSWNVDATFEEVLVRQAMPFRTGSGALVLSTLGPLPETPQPGLAGAGEILDALNSLDCSPRGSSIDLLLLDGCDDAASSDAEQGDQGDVATCREEYLQDVSAVTERSEFILIDEAGASGAFSAIGLSSAPQVLGETGLVVALVHAIPSPPAQCQTDDFTFPAGRPAALHVWDGPGEGGYVLLNNLGVADTAIERALSSAVSLGSVNDDLLVVASESLIRVQLDGGFSRIGLLDEIDANAGVPASRSIDGGTELIDVRDGQLRRVAVSDSGVSIIEESVFEQAGIFDVRFVDDAVIIAGSPIGDRAIRLG